MATKRSTTTKVKRDPKTGRFVPCREARYRKSTEIVESIKRKKR